MPKNHELDRLKTEEQHAFELKQTAFQKYIEAKNRTDQAYKTQQSAWENLNHARSEMNREFESMQSARAHSDSIWDEYKRVRDHNNFQIESLKHTADSLYYSMSDAFSRATDAYDYGDKADAKMYSNEGKSYQAQLAGVNAQIAALGQEVKNARLHAEAYGGQKDSSAFNRAKDAFEQAKAVHKSAEADFKAAKAEKEHLYSEFQSLNVNYKHKKEEFEAALKRKRDSKAARQRADENLMHRAGVPLMYQKDCKVVRDSDGTVNFYFGGVGEKDGLWHGHISMDSNGNVTYRRMPIEDHGKQNFTDQQTLADGIYHGIFDGKPAIIKKSDTGNSDQMQIFYGGKDAPDGEGHSHINTIHGNVRYWREDGRDLIDNKTGEVNI